MRRAAEERLTLFAKGQRQGFHYCIPKVSRESTRLEEGKDGSHQKGRAGTLSPGF